MADMFVVIEHGATGDSRVHGPYPNREEAGDAVLTWKWSRWTKSVEVGVLGNPKHSAYASMDGRGWDWLKAPANVL